MHSSPPETPINTGNSDGKMKGDGVFTALMYPDWSTFRAQRTIMLTLRDSGAISER